MSTRTGVSSYECLTARDRLRRHVRYELLRDELPDFRAGRTRSIEESHLLKALFRLMLSEAGFKWCLLVSTFRLRALPCLPPQMSLANLLEAAGLLLKVHHPCQPPRVGVKPVQAIDRPGDRSKVASFIMPVAM